MALAARCNVELPLGNHLIPEFVPPEEFTKEAYLRQLVQLGLEDRYDGNPSQVHLDRAEFELGVIEQMGFVDYFLVVWDLINHARNKGIPVGPGRGSGAGSLVAYALQITNIDPIRYGLLFERFLNPERVSMPDFRPRFLLQPPRRDHRVRSREIRPGERQPDHHLRPHARQTGHPQRRSRARHVLRRSRPHCQTRSR